MDAYSAPHSRHIGVIRGCCRRAHLACPFYPFSPVGYLAAADPTGRYGIVQSTGLDDRFQVDPDNPTVRSATGFPMCVPRSDPAAGDDPLCPVSCVTGCPRAYLRV